MVNAAIVLALMATAASPDAILLETRVDEKAALPVADDVDTFIGERMKEAWGITVLRQDRGGDAGRVFVVDLHWFAPDEVNIRIAEPGEVHVDRSVPIDDRSAARALVWLLVRSTIERVVLRGEDTGHQHSHAETQPAPIAPAAEAPAAETPPVATPPVAAAPEVPEPQIGTETTTVAEAAPETPVAEDMMSDVVPSATMRQSITGERSVSDMARDNYNQLSATASAPVNLGGFSGLSVGLVARGYGDTSGTGLQASPNLQVRLRNGNWNFGGEVGYRRENPTGGTFDHVPVSVLGGYTLGLGLELGVMATADFKRINLSDGMGQTARGQSIGLLAGGYLRGAWAVYDSDVYELAVVADLSFSPYLLRQRYVVGQLRVDEGPFLVGAGVGMEIRWH